jgi:hypothetical protein
MSSRGVLDLTEMKHIQCTYRIYHWSQPGVRVPLGAHENILHQGAHGNILHQSNHLIEPLNLEPALILALTKIRPRTEVLECQKQAQSSHYQVRTTIIIDKIFNYHLINNLIIIMLF